MERNCKLGFEYVRCRCYNNVYHSRGRDPIIPDPLPVTVSTSSEVTYTVTDHGDSSKLFSVYADGDLDDPRSSTAGIKVNVSDFTLDISLGLDDIGVYGSLTRNNTENCFGFRLNLSELKLGVESSTAISWDQTTHTQYTNASLSGWWIAFAYAYITTGQPICPTSPAGSH